MATETKRILRIEGSPSNIQPGQICIEASPDAFAGKRALAWRDHQGVPGVALARDEPARVLNLRITDLDAGIATVDADGDLNTITIDYLRDLLGSGGAGDPDLGLKVSATITADTDDFVVDTLAYVDIDEVGSPLENPVYHCQLEYLFSVLYNGTVYSGVIHGQASTGELPQ